jgi:hypothetical protein
MVFWPNAHIQCPGQIWRSCILVAIHHRVDNPRQNTPLRDRGNYTSAVNGIMLWLGMVAIQVRHGHMRIGPERGKGSATGRRVHVDGRGVWREY